MFTKPKSIPTDTNCLPFIWTYIIKDGGTQAPCNDSPRMQGTATLADTYAASLDQTVSKVFWTISVAKGHIVVGADASNAFSEAPAHTAPLYLRIDTQFHAWWKSKGLQPIPDGYGVKLRDLRKVTLLCHSTKTSLLICSYF